MNELNLNLPYFYGNEKDTFLFCKFPKAFFTDERFKKMSSDGKLLYTFMLDRVALSIASNWRDEDGRVYIICTNEEACDLLKKSKKTISSVMNELGEEQFGLIERKKQGLGRADLIFVKNVDFLTSEKAETEECSPENGDNTKQGNPQKSSASKGKKGKKSTKNTEDVASCIVENYACDYVENSVQGEILLLQSGNNSTYRGVNFTPQEEQKFPPIKTDITNNETIKNDLLRPTIPPNPQATFPQSMPPIEQREKEWKDLDKEEKIYFLTKQLEQAQMQGTEELASLLYDYRLDENKLELALYILTYMEETEENPNNNEDYSKPHYYLCVKKTYERALYELLKETYTMVRGSKISYSKVIEKLVEHIEYNSYEYRVQFNSIMGCTISAFMKANDKSEISSYVPYMKSCIWTTLCEGKIRHEAEFHRMYG